MQVLILCFSFPAIGFRIFPIKEAAGHVGSQQCFLPSAPTSTSSPYGEWLFNSFMQLGWLCVICQNLEMVNFSTAARGTAERKLPCLLPTFLLRIFLPHFRTARKTAHMSQEDFLKANCSLLSTVFICPIALTPGDFSFKISPWSRPAISFPVSPT